MDVKKYIQKVNDGVEKIMIIRELLLRTSTTEINKSFADDNDNNNYNHYSGISSSSSSNSNSNIQKKIKYIDTENTKIRSVLESAVVLYELRNEVRSYFYAIRLIRLLLGHVPMSKDELFRQSLETNDVSIMYGDTYKRLLDVNDRSNSEYDHDDDDDDKLEDNLDIASIKYMYNVLQISPSLLSSTSSSSISPLSTSASQIRKNSSIVNSILSNKRSLLITDLNAREREFNSEYEVLCLELESYLTTTIITTTSTTTTTSNSTTASADVTSTTEEHL